MADPYTNHDVISATLFQIKGPGQLGSFFHIHFIPQLNEIQQILEERVYSLLNVLRLQ